MWRFRDFRDDLNSGETVYGDLLQEVAENLEAWNGSGYGKVWNTGGGMDMCEW